MQHGHIIVGSGLTGCFIGAMIGQRQPVRFIGREDWLSRLKSGITLTDLNGQHLIFQAAADTCLSSFPEWLEDCVIWLTVKHTALTEVLARLKPVVGRSCVLICCQNGLDAAATARQLFPELRVLQAITGCNIVWDDALNALHKASDGDLYIEYPGQGGLRCYRHYLRCRNRC